MHDLDTFRTPPCNAVVTYAGMRGRLAAHWSYAFNLDSSSTYTLRESPRIDICVRLNSS
jgi:hypothetical protein